MSVIDIQRIVTFANLQYHLSETYMNNPLIV